MTDAACACIFNPSSCNNWSPNPPPQGYCNSTVSASQELDCFCKFHPLDDKCACYYRPSSMACACNRNPSSCATPVTNTDLTVTVTSNADGSNTLTSNNGNSFKVTSRTTTNANEDITVIPPNGAKCTTIRIGYYKITEYIDANGNGVVDTGVDTITVNTTFDVDMSNSDNTAVISDTSTVGVNSVSHVGSSGYYITFNHFLANGATNIYSDNTLNVPSSSLETIVNINNYVSSQSATKICIAGYICVCASCKVTADNVNQVITIDCGNPVTKIFYRNAFIGGSTVNTQVTVDSTANATSCFGFMACFNTFNPQFLVWDPYVQTVGSSSSMPSGASTLELSMITLIIAAFVYLFKY